MTKDKSEDTRWPSIEDLRNELPIEFAARKSAEQPGDLKFRRALECFRAIDADLDRKGDFPLLLQYRDMIASLDENTLEAHVREANAYRSSVGKFHLPQTAHEYLADLLTCGVEWKDGIQ